MVIKKPKKGITDFRSNIESSLLEKNEVLSVPSVFSINLYITKPGTSPLLQLQLKNLIVLLKALLL